MSKKYRELLKTKRVCRFCLKDDEPLTSIFDRNIKSTNSVPLALQIMACVSIEVFTADGMPGTICQVCRYFMDQSYRFKQICRQGDDSLKHFLLHGELRPPIPWPEDLIKNLPEEILCGGSIQVSVKADPLGEGEEEFPYEIESVEMDEDYEAEQQQQEQEQPKQKAVTKQQTATTTKAKPTPADSKDTESGLMKDKFPCDQCHHSFPLKQLLEIHRKKHLKERAHKCHLCDKAFFSKYDLQYHLNTHSDVKNFQCVVCHKRFKRSALLRRHEKIHKTVVKYSCPDCDQTFLTTDHLKQHFDKKHATQKRFECPYCSKRFTFKQSLERHVTSHSNCLPHQCNYCDQSFLNGNKLKRHVLQDHAGTRPYLCKFCPKTFPMSHHYTRHLRTKHMGDPNKPVTNDFKCMQCNISFMNQDDLIFHSAVHATQDLTCPLCKEVFTDVEEVVVHIKTHIDGEQYMCERCDLVFTSDDKLDEHIEAMHKDMLPSQAEEDISLLEGRLKEKNNEEVSQETEEQMEETEEYLEEEEEEGEDVEESEESQDVKEIQQSIANDSNTVVLEWNQAEGVVQQELMVVGGGETMVYQISDGQTVVDTSQNSTGMSIKVMTPESQSQTTESAAELTPIYAELKTVTHPLYAKGATVSYEVEDKQPENLPKTPTKTVQTPEKLKTEESFNSTSENNAQSKTTGLASILQKAAEVNKQKQRLEALKMKAREEMMKKKGEEDSQTVHSSPKKIRKDDSVSEKKSSADSPTKSGRKPIEKILTPTKKLFEQSSKPSTPKTSSSSSSSQSVSPNKKDSESGEATPNIGRSGEKSLMMLERDIMELKKNAGQSPNSKPRFPGRLLPKIGRAFGNVPIKITPKKLESPSKKTKDADLKQTKLGRTPTLSVPIPIKPLQPEDKSQPLQFIKHISTPSQLHKQNITTKSAEEKDKDSVFETDANQTEEVEIQSSSRIIGSESPPRRSRRASKIKDYAAMIRDCSKVGSDDENEDGGMDADQDYQRDSLPEDSDDDIDVNEEVLIHRATPSTRGRPKIPGRKRGRPKKQPAEEEDESPSPKKKPPHTAAKPSKSVEIPEKPAQARMISTGKAAAQGKVETPVKRKRGRPSKIAMQMRESASQVQEEEVSTPLKRQEVKNQVSKSADKSPSMSPQKPSASIVKSLSESSKSMKQDTVIMSPGGQTLKKVSAQMIKSLPPGVKPLPLPASASSPMVSQMKIGQKTVRVQKIVMTKSQLQEMAKKGLVEIKDGAMVLKPGIKLPELSKSPSKQEPSSATAENTSMTSEGHSESAETMSESTTESVS